MFHKIVGADTNPGEHCDQCVACGTAWDYSDSLATGVMMPNFISYWPCGGPGAAPCPAGEDNGPHHFMATGPDSAECHYCGEGYEG